MALPELNQLSQFEQKQIEEQLSHVRKQPLKEAHAQEILENWIQNGPKLTEDQGKEIGLLYVREILELDPDKTSWLEIKEKLSGISSNENNVRKFWQGVSELAPSLVRTEDLEYIIKAESVGGDVGFKMIMEIASGPRGYQHTLLSNIYNGAPS